MQFFAGPKMPRDLSAEWQRKQEKQANANALVGSKMKRRTK